MSSLQEQGTLILQSAVAVVLAFIVYVVVAILVNIAFYYLNVQMTIMPASVVMIMAIAVGSCTSIFVAKAVCDAVLRHYSEKAVCVFFEAYCATTLIVIAVRWSKFDGSQINYIVQSRACAYAAAIVFWNRKAEFRRKAHRYVPYATGIFWIAVSIVIMYCWPEPTGFMYLVRGIVVFRLLMFGLDSLRVAIFYSDEQIGRVVAGKPKYQDWEST